MLRKKKKNKKETIDVLPVIEDDIFSTTDKSDFSKSLEVMFNDDNEEKKSDLTSKQISKLNKIAQMADYYDSPLLLALYERFVRLRVSKAREGRKEGVTMTQQIAQFKRLEALERLERSRKWLYGRWIWRR